MTADWTDDNPSAHRALAIYGQRVPLAHNATGIVAISTGIAGGGFANVVTNAAIDQPSLQCIVGVNAGVVGTTIPFLRLRFQWTDTASGFTLEPDWCFLAGAASGLNFHYIKSPVRADTLTIRADNLDPAQIISISIGASAVSHVYEEFVVEEVGGQAVLGFARPAAGPQMGVLGSVNAVIPISGTVDRLATCYNGKAILTVNNSAGTAIVRTELVDPGVVLGVGPILGLSNSGILATLDANATPPANMEVSLPNGPVVIREINTSGAATQQPTSTLTRARL